MSINDETLISYEPKTAQSVDAQKSLKLLLATRKFTYTVIKRIFDICVGLIGSFLTLFILLGVKISYLINKDKNPILLAQERIGKDGTPFQLYKIRTMVPGAQEMLPKLLSENPKLEIEYKKNKKLENDPRVTKVGKVLRKLSIDESPQFVNVLKGDMSIIGNRPYLPEERRDMGGYFEIITESKPGIISYWAVNGRNDVSFNTRLQLEEYYAIRKNLLLDLSIGLSAVKIVFKSKGAK